MLGEFRDYLPVTEGLIENITAQVVADDPLVAMRVLWMLEKLCTSEEYFATEAEAKQSAIFEQLLALPLATYSFPLKYQTLKTLQAYIRRIDLRATRPDYRDILALVISSTLDIITLCNEETVHIPVQVLTYFTKVEQQVTLELHNSRPDFMPMLLDLYAKYAHDGLLEDDIVQLLKVQSMVQGSQSFRQVVITKVAQIVRVFY